jgi:anti-sigma regulatory factor (Ser/Thr protein kinase)
LGAAERELSSSFDYPTALAAVARLIVPEYACGFCVEVDEGQMRVTLAHAGGFEEPTREVVLVSRGRRLGTMRIAGPGFDALDASELDVWDELALRIATSIEAAQTYAREHHIADTLQHAFLPERLPTDDRLRFDAAYLPGATEAVVGGDWYDAFHLPDGRVAFSIGDVAGHGLPAAIVMGEVRQAFRAAALNPSSPSLVLERANAIVNMRANPVMVTAIFGIIDPRDATITYAAAGHPPPIVGLPDGSAHALPTDGVPLGIVEKVGASDWTFTLPPGALFAVYTDGLIEYSRDVLEGEARLLDAVRAGALLGVREPARALIEHVFAQCANSDDVATLTVTSGDVASRSFSFAFSAVPMAVPMVRRTMRRYAEGLGLDEDARFALLTASGEAIANAVEHAYLGAPGLVRVSAQALEETLIVSVEDEGKWRPAQRRDERGRGLPLMRALMDAVEIRTDHSRTEVRLTMALRRARTGRT